MAKFLLVRRNAATVVAMRFMRVPTTTTKIVILYPLMMRGSVRTFAYAARLNPFGRSIRDAVLPTMFLEREHVTQYQKG